ncbi:MAG: protein phosphatase 2C domain-containing protein [Methanobacterium sp.]
MEIKKIQIKSDKKSICEDYFVMDEKNGIFAVLDGATSISNFVDNEGRNGAVLASRIVGNAIKNIGNTSIKSYISNANLLLLEEMKKYNIDLTKKEELWSTCLAMVKFNENYIDFGQIGDCMLFGTTRVGEFKILSKDMVFGISERAKQKREKERLEGRKIPSEDYYNNKKNSLIYNRYLANKENGYAVLNGDKGADNFLNVGMLQKEEYSEILLITDGLFPKDRDWENMFNQIKKCGLYNYAANLIEFENLNNLTQDDKTGIFIKF